MLDCRKALTENNGDFEAAIDWLRKKQDRKVAAKPGDREKNEKALSSFKQLQIIKRHHHLYQLRNRLR